MPVKTPAKKTNEKQKSPKWPLVIKTNEVLGVVFYVIWILVGIFFLLYVVASIRQGALKYLTGSTPPPAQQESTQAPTETTLPGIGKVNIECVQSSVSTETIQKIIQDQSMDNLTDEEKTKLEPCIIDAEAAQENPSE